MVEAKTESRLLKFIKQLIVLLVIFYVSPIVWWQYNDMDDRDLNSNTDTDYFMSIKFLMSSGLLMTIIGFSYVACTSVDVIPNIIPFVGKLDDSLFKMIFGAGLMLMYCGYTFGTGPCPKMFDIMVKVITWLYNIIVPFIQNIIMPVLIPFLKALAIPMKAAVRFVLNKILDKAKDPTLQEQAINLVKDATTATATAAGAGTEL